MLDNGADKVVNGLREVALIETDHPLAMVDCFESLKILLHGKKPALFLDYDGTLTAIVDHPDLAVLSDTMKNALQTLQKRCPIAVISGRDLEDVRKKVGLSGMYYAGSHGFDMLDPEGRSISRGNPDTINTTLDQAEATLKGRLSAINGILLERKKYSLAVHYRQVAVDNHDAVRKVVEGFMEEQSALQVLPGKMVFDLKPAEDWHKGKAIQWILQQLPEDDRLAIFIGDDTTDEDGFRTFRESGGVGIVVMNNVRPTAARFRLNDVQQVEDFLKQLAQWLGEKQ